MDGEEETEPMPASVKPIEGELIPTEASAIAQPNLEKMGPTWSFFSIPQEGVASVKDSITSRLFAQGPAEGVEASGSSRRKGIPKFKFAEG